jgi:hypothetical protein
MKLLILALALSANANSLDPSCKERASDAAWIAYLRTYAQEKLASPPSLVEVADKSDAKKIYLEALFPSRNFLARGYSPVVFRRFSVKVEPQGCRILEVKSRGPLDQ